MNSLDNLREKIASLSDTPGVYLMKDEAGKVIYIGKAKSLRKRLQSYFSRQLSCRFQTMLSKVVDIEYRLVPSEAQAQLLEASLIKENQPPYNISLKDDKSFPWVKISAEEFPVVSICRRKGEVKAERSLYFGPYPNVKLLRQQIKVMRRIFGFRSCKILSDKPCLYYRLELCPAPCIKRITPKRYRQTINQIKMFLQSRHEKLIRHLACKMKEAAKGERFEEAAKIRNQLNALSVMGQGEIGITARNELEDLKSLLGLDKLPLRIEAFDISDISGKEACGAMVSFYQGLPDKNNYRRFGIKTVAGIDDYACLREIVNRRYSRLRRENTPLPDLVLIDGGKAHLAVVEREMKTLGICIPLVSMAKDKENIYTQDRRLPIKLNQDTSALKLLRRIRDEAHRFAVSYHHILRRKKIIGR